MARTVHPERYRAERQQIMYAAAELFATRAMGRLTKRSSTLMVLLRPGCGVAGITQLRRRRGQHRSRR